MGGRGGGGGARTWLGLDPGAMAPPRPGRVDGGCREGGEQPISLPTTLRRALRMRRLSQGRRKMLATVQKRLRALRAQTLWDQHLERGWPALEMSRGLERTGLPLIVML